MWRVVGVLKIDVSEKRVAQIFRIEEITRARKRPRSYETSVFTRLTRRHIPEDSILHNHRREKLRCYKFFIYNVSKVRGCISPISCPFCFQF
jgi:hypothetical protein